ncbi:hypothetical protein [Candidatus Tisiphia endosymbiont of Nemotelus uliginosus]|uniref:hypothetical protein n=1 Tax=Candidatus Tisiphia endosymbiont of Nemotelus uliginosus TaxID=3077926 RepID=UPI0035C8A6F3
MGYYDFKYVDKSPFNIETVGHESFHVLDFANGHCALTEEELDARADPVEKEIQQSWNKQYASGRAGSNSQSPGANSYNTQNQDQSQHQYQRGGIECGVKHHLKLICDDTVSPSQRELIKQVLDLTGDVYSGQYGVGNPTTCSVTIDPTLIYRKNTPGLTSTACNSAGHVTKCFIELAYVNGNIQGIKILAHENTHGYDAGNGRCGGSDAEGEKSATWVEKRVIELWPSVQYASGRGGGYPQASSTNSYNTQNQDQSQHQYQRGGIECGNKHNLKLFCDHTVSPSQRELMKQVLDLTGDVYSSQYSVGNPITCSVTIDPTLIYIDRLGDMLPYYGPTGHPNACRLRLARFNGNIQDIAVAAHENTHAYDASNGREATEQNANWVAGRVKKLWQSGQYLSGGAGGYSQDSGANVYNTKNQGQSQHQSNQPPCPNQQYQSNQPPCQKQQHQSNTKSPSQHQSPNGGNTEVILLHDPSSDKYKEYECPQGTVKLDPPVLNVDFNIIRGNPHCSPSNIGAHRLANRKISIKQDIIIVKSKEGSEDKASVIKYDFQNDLLSMFLESDSGSIIQYMCNILHAKYWPHCPLGNFYYSSITNRTPAAVKLAANEFLVKVIKQYCNNQGEVQSSGHRPAAPSTNKPYDYNPVSTQQAGHDPRTGGEIELDPEVEGDIELEDLPPEHTPSTQRSPSETQTAGPVRKVENNAMIYVQTQALNKNPDKPIFSPSVATVSQEYLIYGIKAIQIKVNLDNSSDTTHYLCPKKLSEYYSDTFIAELPPITEEVFKEYISSCSVVQHMGRILPKGSVDHLEKLPDPQKLVQLPPPQLMRNFAEGFIGTDSSNKSSISIELKVAIGVGVVGALLTGAGFAWCIMTCYKKIHPKPPALNYPPPEDGQHGGNQKSDHVKRSLKSKHTIIKLEENSESEDEDDSVHTTHAVASSHHVKPVSANTPPKQALLPLYKSSKLDATKIMTAQHPDAKFEKVPPLLPLKDYKPYKPVYHPDDYPGAHFSSVPTKDDYTDYYDVEVLAKYPYHSTEL